MSKSMVVLESLGEVDLLQQALAGATADDLMEPDSIEQHEVLDQNELLSILEDHPIEHQTIQLTAEQAAALGLRIEVDPIEDTLKSCNNVESDEEIYETISLENTKDSSLQHLVADVLKNVPCNVHKPLGSRLNPIKLIQQGHHIRSIQPMNPKQASELRNVLQHQKIRRGIIDSTSDNIVVDAATKTRIIYRTVFPEELDLQTPRRGRPSKRGRPKKGSEKPPDKPSSPELPAVKPIRTRSGRVTKPPRHKNFRILQEVDTENLDEETGSFTITSTNSVQVPPSIVEKVVEKQPVLFTGLPRQKRNIASQFRCPTCKKAYLGYSRMERHLRLFPDHGPLPAKRRNATLWETALKLAGAAPVGSRGLTLLNDLELFTTKIRDVTWKFLQPATNHSGIPFEVNESLSMLLRISPGKYTINESVLFDSNKSDDSLPMRTEAKVEPPDTNGHAESQFLNEQVTPHAGNDGMILPVDTGQVPILDTNGSSDEIICVDQLVNERLHSLTAAELAPPTSNPHPLSLDLSLDLFQFHPS